MKTVKITQKAKATLQKEALNRGITIAELIRNLIGCNTPQKKDNLSGAGKLFVIGCNTPKPRIRKIRVVEVEVE